MATPSSAARAAQPTHPSAAAPPRVRGQLGRLFLEESRERNSSTSSTASTSSSDGGGGELESASPESYCLWTPGGSSSSSPRPSPPRKSGSTGSMARWRRISELVVGRSHSDGKDKFMFFPAPQPSKPNKPKDPAALSSNTTKHHDKPKPSPAIRKQASPAEVEAAHRIVYGGGVPGASPRRPFLPYRRGARGILRQRQRQRRQPEPEPPASILISLSSQFNLIIHVYSTATLII
ncbi:hypothetical protein PR202_gb29954 [Eleusine coracana subsp. coracana]|uniref:Uncharacterized protein n=1 Tax=Eleusine coracana subsp. coracana TaxID=191504 RepID=A0AAV5FYC3_ELECO|nr:hypothetical protein PR202_gb29954 [Eleusine coracana subsp. coracana]